MSTSFKNSRVIIAGGSSGIGLATAKQLAAQQAQVTVTGRDDSKLSAVRALNMNIATARVDGRDRTAVDAFFKEHGAVDHLIIALSGGKGMGVFKELSLQDLRDAFNQKFWAQLDTLQAALPYMKATGSITLITAISPTAQLPGTSGLAAVNGALEIMIPVLAKEIRPVRINAVSPGVIDTPWWSFLPEEAKQKTFEQFGSQTLVGRVGQPEEIADVIVFLASNGYMTGKVIGCDGGLG